MSLTLFRATQVSLLMIVALSMLPLSTSQAESRPDGRVPNRFIVSFESGVVNTAAVAAEIAAIRGVQVRNRFNYALKGVVIEIPSGSAAGILTALRKNPRVRGIAADHYISVAAETKPKGVRRVSAELGIGVRANSASSVDVVVMDTGIDFSHPDLTPNVDTVNSVQCLTGMPCVSGGQDDRGHGTNVASAVAAAADVSGIVGVAPAVNLISVKVFDANGNGTFGDVIAGIDYIIGLNAIDLVEVVNMSFVEVCDPDCGDALYVMVHDAVKALVASGTTVIAAAGNDSINVSLVVPAGWPELITVSAMADSDGLPGALSGLIRIMFQTYADDSFASFSNYGSGVDVIAPGVKELLAKLGGGTEENTGTSFAAPYAAGVAAIFIRDRLDRGEQTPLPGTVRQALIETGECYDSGSNAGLQFHGISGCPQSWPDDTDGAAEPLVRADNVANFEPPLPDVDGDGVPDAQDNCQVDANPLQENNDGDAEGDVCDDDDDNDGLTDVEEMNFDGDPAYNPSTDTNPLLADTDGDGISDFDEVNYDGLPAYNALTDINPLSNNTDGDAYLDGMDPVPLNFNYEDGDVAPWGSPNSVINAGDLLVCMQFVLGVKAPTNDDLAHGDLHPIGAPDGQINISDYIQLLKLVLY